MPQSSSSSLAMWRPHNARYEFRGLVGQRLAANTDRWLLVAPQANPAMLEMFRDRDRLPRRDLVPWAGEFAGKYLTSAVLCLRLSHDERLRAQLDSIVRELISVQAPDGYLGPFPEHERLTGRTPDGERALWDLWGHYHCMLGLLLWYQETSHTPALNASCRAADHICGRFLDREERVIDAGAEEMNMAVSHIFALLYQETGDPRYLRMVREIEADWRTPAAGDYVMAALVNTPFYETRKPRWESLHDIQAILALYQITGQERYRRAFEQIWRSIVSTDRHNTGGFSSGERATGNPYDPRAIETCCTVAWMALSVDMLRLTGDSRVADELELSTLNAAMGAQSPSGRWWAYNTPMDGVRKASAHEIVFQAREGSPELNCCSVNGPRGLGMLSEWSIMQNDDGVALNYFGPSVFAIELPTGHIAQLTQNTDYPRGGRVQLSMGLAEPERFALRLRIPAWSRRTAVAMNGEAVTGVTPGCHLVLERRWCDEDTVSLELDMSLRPWFGEREAEGKVSLYRGPLLLACDGRFNAKGGIEPSPLHLSDLDPAIVEWREGWPAPWLLLRVCAADGQHLLLCDFATAGAAGTPYLTWLPLS